MNRFTEAALAVLIYALCIPMTACAEEGLPGTPFQKTSADGVEYALPSGQDGVGLYLFWASWCPYCRALMPHLQSIVDEYPAGLTVYALHFRDDKDPVAYLDERGFDFVVFPEADDIASLWGAHGTPALYLIDEKGDIRFDLYQVLADDPEGFSELNHTQKAQRRAPFWAARLRSALDEVLAEQDGRVD